jgi:PASTA domain
LPLKGTISLQALPYKPSTLQGVKAAVKITFGPGNLVVDQDPKPGQDVDRGSSVKLTVSSASLYRLPAKRADHLLDSISSAICEKDLKLTAMSSTGGRFPRGVVTVDGSGRNGLLLRK